MNIFILDEDIVLSARYHCDKHVVKMPTETAQLLTAAVHTIGGDTNGWKPTHVNHPCAKWTRYSKQNFEWLCKFGLELCVEYTYRYGRIIKSEAQIRHCYSYSDRFPDNGLSPFELCVPEQHKGLSIVESYRNYYRIDKAHILKYKNREIPEWVLK